METTVFGLRDRLNDVLGARERRARVTLLHHAPPGRAPGRLLRGRGARWVVVWGCLWLGAGVAAAAPSVPRNIILFIGDGCGYNHLQAASLYQQGRTNALSFQSFPVQYAVNTFSAGGSYHAEEAAGSFNYFKQQVTDSAAAATALATGHKTRNGALGVSPDGSLLTNVLECAERRMKRTGVVTTVPWSHATPAGFAVHVGARNSYREIASNMVFNTALDVIMGCGHPEGVPPPAGHLGFWGWISSWFSEPPPPATAPEVREDDPRFQYVGGVALWKGLRAGTAGGDADGDGSPDPWTLVETHEGFRDLIFARHPPRRVLGTALAGQTLQQDRPRPDGSERPYQTPLRDDLPTLAEMTRAALNVLSQGTNGLVLMVEGGAIDWAAHGGQSARVIEEVLALNAAVEAAIRWVESHGGWEETLVLVTADHETGYLWGAGSGQAHGQPPVWLPLESKGRKNMPNMQWNTGGHTNQRVPLYARGCGAERLKAFEEGADPVRGAFIDNTSIARLIFELLSDGAGARDAGR